jgi:hypothetical protein
MRAPIAAVNGPEDCASGSAANVGMGSAGEFRGRRRSLYEGGIALRRGIA